MVKITVLLTWASLSTGTLEGQATYYRPGLMQQVADYRGYDLGDYVGGVALNRRGDMGRVVWLGFGHSIEGPFLVIDCAQREHYKARERQGRVVETDAKTAKRHGFYGIGPAPVQVYFEDMTMCTSTGCAK